MKKRDIFCVLTAVTLFFVIGCKNEAEEDPQKVIRISGLTNYIGKYAAIGLGSRVTGNLLALSSEVVIPINGSIDTYLFNAENENKWTASGDYIVVLLIADRTGATIYYRGAVLSVSLSSEITELPFTSFTEVSLQNVLGNNFESLERSLFLFKDKL